MLKRELLQEDHQYNIVITIDGLIHNQMDHPALNIPNLRWLASHGVRAEKVKCASPTITWSNHASIITGTFPRKHGIIGNWVIDRTQYRVGEFYGDEIWTKEEAIHGKTLYDEAKGQGLTTAAIGWPATRGASTIDYLIPYCKDQLLLEASSTKKLWDELLQLGLPVNSLAAWMGDKSRCHLQDQLTTDIAKHVIRKHRPHLLLLRYATTDCFQHIYGPHTNEALWAVEYIDGKIGEIMAQLQESGIWEQSNLFVFSDHGFAETKKTIYPNVLFKQKGWIQENHVKSSKVIATSNGGTGFVYVLEEEPGCRAQLISAAKEALLQTEGVERIVDEAEFARFGMPGAGEYEAIRPDFMFETGLDYFIHYDGFDAKGNDVVVDGAKFKGMHGHSADYDSMKGFYLAAGCSVKEAVVLPEINIVDIAPTIANCFQGELEDADGIILNDMLRP
jgi:predicted AlkP superfamily pyrophosphatase or phosphodiesterase